MLTVNHISGLGLAMLLALAACTLSDPNTVDWSHINYAKIECEKDPKPAGCKTSNDSLIAIGRGKK